MKIATTKRDTKSKGINEGRKHNESLSLQVVTHDGVTLLEKIIGQEARAGRLDYVKIRTKEK